MSSESERRVQLLHNERYQYAR